jgi:uncharacterized membrane protein YfcA
VNNPIVLILFGVLVGVFSGVMGLGGGAVIIPVLVLVFDMSQQSAHGTSLAMILSPTALPAIFKYHAEGFVNWRLVMYVIPGMLLGSYAGAWISTSIPQTALKLVFGFTLIYVAGYTIFGVLGGRAQLARTLVLSGALVLVAVALFASVRWFDQRAAAGVAAADTHSTVSAKPNAHG